MAVTAVLTSPTPISTEPERSTQAGPDTPNAAGGQFPGDSKGRAASIASIEQQLGVDSLVDALFWIPTNIWKTAIPVEPSPPPSLDMPIEHTYLNCTIRTPPEQVAISPPLTRFVVDAPFRATNRKNSPVSNQLVAVYVYGLIKDCKALSRTYLGDSIVLKGFLRYNPAGAMPNVELHGAALVARDELTETTVSYAARGNSAPKNLQSAIYNALQMCVPHAVRRLKEAVELRDSDKLMSLMNLGLTEISFASPEAFFWALHLPESDEQHEAAKHVARNLGCAEIMRRAARAAYQPDNPEAAIPLDRKRTNELIRRMGLKPTKDQVTAMMEIYADLVAPKAMRRLLSGDVGTGKTATFGVLAASVREAGGWVAIFIPNGVLASQVAEDFKKWWPEIPVALVTGSQKPSKDMLAQRPILIGTSAILNYWPANVGTPPNLLIVDEQQKSSREQRERIMGPQTNFLEATATCLPRTMGLVEHGSLSVSNIREQPVKKGITSKIITGESKREVFAEIHELLAKGHRCAIVLPEVEARLTGDAEVDAESEKKAVTNALTLWEKIFPGKVIGLHGRMKEGEKIEALGQVKRGEFPIVLATSLIEIGVTIPNLSMVLVAHPEKYGASSLHQLRGRLVRNGGEGTFYLLVEEVLPKKTMDRLKAVCSTTDGFELALADFEMRGFGDLAEDSSEQSGQPVCIFKNIRIKGTDIERVVRHLGDHRGLSR